MAEQLPPNVVSLLKELVGAVITQQAQIAELQGDRTTQMQVTEGLEKSVAALQEHAETVAGETGLTSQLGDLSTVPALHDQLTAALPAPAADAAPASAEPQAA
ncbi:hypothetical protein ABC766_29540 [Methylobacterium fujisawaense]|uniref:hypothetical protein n=1 Tax=Methylobacterium fujisawaense TaxID=107400 RepID=UPI0031F52497